MNFDVSSSSDELSERLMDLREAQAQPALDAFIGNKPIETSLARRAAYQLAVAMGRCRLFGVEVGEEDGTLIVPLVVAAIEQWRLYAQKWMADVARLPSRLDHGVTEIEAEDQCLDLLEARMETWALFVAVDESYEDCLDRHDSETERFGAVLDHALEELATLDHELQQNDELLSVIAGTCLLDNWRRLLAKPYGQVMPWWLDGSLEVAYKRIQDSLVSNWPNPRRGKFPGLEITPVVQAAKERDCRHRDITVQGAKPNTIPETSFDPAGSLGERK